MDPAAQPAPAPVPMDAASHPQPAAASAAATQGAPAAGATDTPGARPPFDPIEALKLGGLRLASIIRANKPGGEAAPGQQQGGEAPVVARIRATAAGLSAKAKEQGSRFYQASVTTAASTAEGIKRLALGEPLQALCRSECAVQPCPQLVLASCTALVAGGGLTTQRIFKHDPPPELVDRLAAAAGSLSLLPPGASPHAVAGLLKRFLLGLPEPLLTYRLLPQWVAAGDHPASCTALLPQLPAANLGTFKLLMQVCALIHAEAAQNEMDALALAEVLLPCLAWKPPAKPQGSGGPGPFAGLAKVLSAKASGAAAAGLQPGSGTDAQGTGKEGEAAAAGTQGTLDELEEARVVQLNEEETAAVVTVVEHIISNYSSVFGSSSSSSHGNPSSV